MSTIFHISAILSQARVSSSISDLYDEARVKNVTDTCLVDPHVH